MSSLPKLPTTALTVAATIFVALTLLLAAQGAQAGVTSSLAELERAGYLPPADARSARSTYLAARSLRRRSRGAARTVLSNQLRLLESLARKNRIKADRVRPLMSQLQVNVDWLAKYGPAREGTRSRFGESRIYYQYFSGWGWQFHPLANFAKLNAVWTDKSRGARRALGSYAHELIGFGVVRSGALTWEYYFPFSGSAAPFISSISQGTAIQSLARAGEALADPTITAAATRGALAFAREAPGGLLVRRDGGNHYLGYSGNRREIIFNMFAQSLVGLGDFARITADASGQELLEQGLTAARVELPKSDTGAWSLYELGGAESNLNYHQVLVGFVENLCENTGREALFCDLATRLKGYLTQPPKISRVVKRVRRGRIWVSFRLSKVSTVTVRARSGGVRSATVGRGKRTFSVGRGRSRTVTIFARDLAGNTAETKK
jgi:hypothetical protein